MDLKQAKILIVNEQKSKDNLIANMLRNEGYGNILITNDRNKIEQNYNEFHPDLVLLDIEIPDIDILNQLYEYKNIDYFSVIILTAYTERRMRLKALELGVSDFIRKPYDAIEVLNRIHSMLNVSLLHNKILSFNQMMENKDSISPKKSVFSQSDIISLLGRAAEYGDKETGLHIIRMSHYAYILAKEIGISEQESQLLLHASNLHDIGKIGIPDHILLKPGPLNNQEWEVMKMHTTIGANILSGGKSRLFQLAEVIAKTHHEKWDGTGYPNQLKGEEIPLSGRISAIADVFDALTSVRPYKEEWTTETAVNIIKDNKGKHFDSELVDVFIDILPEILEIRKVYMD